MKAVILAAGTGSRLGESSQSLPKPLQQVNGKAVIVHNIELLVSHGVREVFVNTHHLAGVIKRQLGNGSAWGISIEYSYEENLLGTAGALIPFKAALQNEPFFVIYGDNYSRYDLSALSREHQSSGALVTIALFHKEDVSMSGIVVLDEEQRIVSFIEKPLPEQVVSHWVNAGVYVVSPQIFSFMKEGVSDFGRDLFPSLLKSQQHLHGVVMERAVVAIDTPELLNRASEEARKLWA